MPASNLARGIPSIPDRSVFQDFAPDIDSIMPNVLLDCENVYPTVKGYKSYPSLSRYSSNNLPSACFGAFSGVFGTSNVIVMGTADQIYELSTVTLTSAGLALATIAAPQKWRFELYGNLLIAVNGVDAPKSKTMPAGAWGNLGGSPPVASIVKASDYSLFLIEANSNVWRSSLSATIWTPSIATLTVRAALDQTPGNITAAHDLAGAMALYKRKSLHYSTYGGPPFFWDFNTVSEQVGAPSQEAIANVGDAHYFPGPDDFYSFDGQTLKRIPNNLKEWFFATVDLTKDHAITARWDQGRSLIFWHFASISATGETPDLWICYNLRTGKWSKGSDAIDAPIFTAIQTGNLTYSIFKSTYATYGAVTGTYGDLRSRAIDVSGAIRSSDHGLYLYNGAPGEASITTHDHGDRHNMWMCTGIRPHFSMYPAAGASLQVLNQAKPGDTPTAGLTKEISADGRFNFRNTACLQRFKITTRSEMEIVGHDGLISYAGER